MTDRSCSGMFHYTVTRSVSSIGIIIRALVCRFRNLKGMPVLSWDGLRVHKQALNLMRFSAPVVCSAQLQNMMCGAKYVWCKVCVVQNMKCSATYDV